MNTKLKASALLSITILLAISVVAISEMPEAEAKKDHEDKNKSKDWKNLKKYLKGKPDFVAKINTPNEPEHHNGEGGVALFWVSGEGDNMKVSYKIFLKKIGIGDIEGGLGQEPDKNRYDHYLWKLHVHPAPIDENGVPQHDPTVHLFNIVGPTDDNNMKIKGKMISGKWDKSDAHRTDLPHDHHETNALNEVLANGKTPIELMCSGNTDINVHLEEASHLEVRGQLIPTSKFCDSI